MAEAVPSPMRGDASLMAFYPADQAYSSEGISPDGGIRPVNRSRIVSMMLIDNLFQGGLEMIR
jgi:hypothetical protein